jgi:tripartite-type tricarboxylate transporter receptor subunit TctC
MEPGAVIAKWLNKTVPFDVTDDLSPIAMIATSPLVLFAQPSLPANDVKELICFAKANPRKLSVGTPGVGTPHHLAAAWLNTAAKIDISCCHAVC